MAVGCTQIDMCRHIIHVLIQIEQSIDLTCLSSTNALQISQASQKIQTPVEYSAREVSPPDLLLQQLLRAHDIFLLHQAPSIAELWARTARKKFCGLLKRFWDDFIWSWDVLLHGNPAVDVFNGIKLAAGGELGIGVGEEEWGSGEREVLEGFVNRTEGLVDLVVSRFGDAGPAGQTPPIAASSSAMLSARELNLDWQVTGRLPQPSDGLIFSGVGALTRSSVKSISSWAEWIHMFGHHAYGVRDNPASAPRRKFKAILPSRLTSKSSDDQQPATSISGPPREGQDAYKELNALNGPKIPPPLVAAASSSPAVGTKSKSENATPNDKLGNVSVADEEAHESSKDTIVKYLTLGVYGSTWGIPSARPPQSREFSRVRDESEGKSAQPPVSTNSTSRKQNTKPTGYFLIGLQGSLDEDVQFFEDEQSSEPATEIKPTSTDGKEYNSRISKRTVNVERVRQDNGQIGQQRPSEDNPLVEISTERLRVVVYVKQPFIFTFVFDLQTDPLEIPTFYRSLDHQLGPLQRPLLSSTSPQKVKERLWEAASPKSTAPEKNSQPVRDLVYDPVRLTVHTSIDNIPEPGRPSTDASSWTRVEALNVHSQILNTYSSTRQHTADLERISKTSRGYWVVWMRLPHAQGQQDTESGSFREAFLIRKASDYVAPTPRKASGKSSRDLSGSAGSGSWAPGKLAEGIGIDARQYIDSLLSLNR